MIKGSDDALDELYREDILYHSKNPRYRRQLKEPDILTAGYNPLCGDEITLQMKLDGDIIKEIGVIGRGCSISQASSSILAEQLSGKKIKEAEALSKIFKKMMHGEELKKEEFDKLGELEALSGVKKYPVRIKCALLAWTTLDEGIKSYKV